MKKHEKTNQQFEHGVLSVLDFEIVLEKNNLRLESPAVWLGVENLMGPKTGGKKGPGGQVVIRNSLRE